MKYGLIGERLTHSFSKIIHSSLGNGEYELCPLSPDELDRFMTERDFCAINVTIPYKKAVIPYLSHISDEAREIGAVNTVINRGGELWGYNTDFAGMKELVLRVLARAGRGDLEGVNVLVLGSGGTSLTAKAVCRALGAQSVTRVSRSAKDDTVSYESAITEHAECGFIINCTPCGMYPDAEGIAIDISRFQDLIGVVDAVYNPIRTPLIRAARERKVACEGGLYMLVSQAVAAHSLFFGKESISAEDIYSKLLCDRENIVLVGMPSSGKSSVGRLIAEKTGREFIDTDELIVKKEGADITTIFNERGEDYFRDIEALVIKECSLKNGVVISCGGGAVLRSENISRLRANGRIYYLDRPLSMLTPTSDRPTALDPEAMAKRYVERKEIYEHSCDHRADSLKSVSEVADEILCAHVKGVRS